MLRHSTQIFAALAVCSSLAAATTTAYAAATDKAFPAVKIIGLRVEQDGDLSVFTSAEACVDTARVITVKAGVAGYESLADTLTAAYLSGSPMTLRTHNTTCAIVALRIGDES